MPKRRSIVACLSALLMLASVASAQKKAQPTTGGVKGKVRVDSSTTPEGVRVTLRRGEEVVAHAETDRKGEFEIAGVAPGAYSLRFQKAGLQTAELKPYEIRAGKVGSLGERVFLPVDEGSIAFLKGAVFTAEGRSVGGARVELLLFKPDGTLKKIDGRVSNESGEFSFRLLPQPARYRVTAKGDGVEAAKDVQIEGAMVYRVALSLKPTQ
ncbi:MAG: carboxypeptidase-like regulatory domain-containing protein [Acidobacteria bacterium]|nr:carboxypeptidase-like regulatory domain-containing protein [Acidobacteriota bacterium]MCA1640538.1 carboxypeptidase-like regulatory domain-containing protein [Acidobacteriota bacterium]